MQVGRRPVCGCIWGPVVAQTLSRVEYLVSILCLKVLKRNLSVGKSAYVWSNQHQFG